MQLYKNKSGTSGVTRFQIGSDYIKIEFHPGHIYTYNYIIPGEEHVEKMKELALKGEGLSTYISQNVREKYYSTSS